MACHYEKGSYSFKISNQGFSTSSQGNPQFFLQGMPVGRYLDDGNVETIDDGYPRTITMTLTDKTVDRIIGDLQKLGWQGRKFSELDPDNPKVHSFVGQEIQVDCKHEPGFNDASTLFEKWELPYEGGAPRESDSSIGKKLDALYAKRLGGTKQSKQTAAAAARAGDDDTPF